MNDFIRIPRRIKWIGYGSIIALWFIATSALAQQYWSEVDDLTKVSTLPYHTRGSTIKERRLVMLDLASISSLAQGITRKSGVLPTLMLPTPEGNALAFVIEPSSVLPDELQEKYPSIAAFKGYAVTDPSITLRFELTNKGLSAQILQPGNRWMIDPVAGAEKGVSVVYYTKNAKPSADRNFCEFEGGKANPTSQDAFKKKLFAPKESGAKNSGSKLRTYRLAIAATGEYGEFHGGQKASILAAVTTTINRVTGILEKEVALRLALVPDNDKILYTSVATSPFTGNNDASTLINESQTQIDLVIGAANYDIGHTFSTGAGGLASLGSVCNSLNKARGVTGSSQPTGDYYDVDFVAHEIGHQLGANHTFNGSNGGCAGSTRNYLTAYEPGSGSTIQAYPSLCGADDLQNTVDPIYHSESFEEIRTYVSEGLGSSCGVLEDTGNTPPEVEAGTDYVVPKGTPLVVSGSATDSEQSTLTYLWEQRDLGSQAALAASDDGEIPLFRVLTPTVSPIRYLPALPSVLSGNFDNSEKIPQVARDMNLRLTARDGFGGVDSDDIVVTVSGSSGPFTLTSPNGGEVVGESKSIRWDVSKTDEAPINVSLVEILLSTNGGISFDTSLGVTTNDGLASISFPSGIQTSSARIMIRAKDNIFYDVSDTNFELDSDKPVPPAPTSATLTPTDGGVSVSFTPGADNGVSVTSYSADCRTEDIVDEYSYSISPAVAIPDQGTIESTLEVDADITISEGGVKIPMDISHTYRGDIVLVLQSPTGTVVSLKNSLGSDSGQNVVGIFPDTLAPADSLDALVGESTLGEWELTTTDSFEIDTGTLNAWGVSLSSVTPGDRVVNQGSSSPIVLTGMQNDETYSCEITAYAGSDPSEAVAMGLVTPTSNASIDTDNDGLTDAEEVEFGTDPNNADSDGDGLLDSDEVALGADPTESDTDGDGYGDGEEVDAGTSPTNAADVPIIGSSILILKAAIDAAASSNP